MSGQSLPRDRYIYMYIAGNFFEQSSHTSVCSKKITRGRQPEDNFRATNTSVGLQEKISGDIQAV
jgi:hypothetical protein